ncbi:MAG TPA: lipopolysaccharide biosynthesis protein, partial [Pirellulales bacterium]|nr:lipopolysaccharide biosynthesis protein [Pirellulales bacterium]
KQHRLKTDTLVGGIAMLLVLTVVQRLVGFGRGILFCRWLAADELGQWDLAYGFLMLAAPLAVLGLPGSLGRYVEYYRQRRQLRRFLLRMGAGTSFVAALAVAALMAERQWFAELFFNTPNEAPLVGVLGIVLATWIVHTGLVALFNALRMTRAVSALQFCHSLAFAVIGCTLLVGFEASARTVVWSFAAAGVLSSLLGIGWLVKSWDYLPSDGSHDEPRPEGNTWRDTAIWRQVAPFALWVWVSNALANAFGLADRWMLIHFSGLSEPEALAQVGQYHSARVVALLFLGIAEMLAGMATPHLACDWEAGRRDEVSRRLNFILKVFALGLYVASVGLLLASPLLFGVALAGKYAAGMVLLPWTLTYCTWGSLAVVATNYLWCAERARWASLSLALGLATNVGLNAWLLPRFGLSGAVWATSAANFTMLAAMYVSAWSCGMRFHRGTLLAAVAPLAVAGGPASATTVLVVLAVLACRGNWLFTAQERKELAGSIHRVGQAVARWRQSRSPEEWIAEPVTENTERQKGEQEDENLYLTASG